MLFKKKKKQIRDIHPLENLCQVIKDSVDNLIILGFLILKVLFIFQVRFAFKGLLRAYYFSVPLNIARHSNPLDFLYKLRELDIPP